MEWADAPGGGACRRLCLERQNLSQPVESGVCDHGHPLERPEVLRLARQAIEGCTTMKTVPARPVRCAIYTRVSTDQGLDQDFNSLDAQYDASQSYIRSQAHAGWTLLRAKYDDGGFSGGNTDRPALQRLLEDIRAGKIDIIVVYKVDRLTRSLADFAFNSLDAQYDASQSYIRSQAHAGWTLLRAKYDDGGFSGGNTDRPALQRLLEDVRAGKIDVIVVYKVDRLTRSFADFAKLVELFDKQNVSFVSVTQQFNTTTSMGRLTLNVLLSFAQFEREVTSERIRDKISASKRKGLWVGGNLPLGYEMKEGKIAVVEEDAELVRSIFRRYLELGSVNELLRDLRERNIRTKRRLLSTGATRGGIPFGRGALYYLFKQSLLYRRGQIQE